MEQTWVSEETKASSSPSTSTIEQVSPPQSLLNTTLKSANSQAQQQ